ncbi:YpzG family protein [Caenibacillus caldisaponilyticus]|uniref:YpzG family protein n=1 Tax=Caenibacillus caldisaponilyticus TaxID=1674942 RepID=UPI0009888EA0|nr:YpzG family protein [Caenibacillus caldisaponilyticus]
MAATPLPFSRPPKRSVLPRPIRRGRISFHQVNGETEQSLHNKILQIQTRK